MNPTLAIAQLALRAALRSRVVLALVGLLLAAALLLPLGIRHDGTPEGLARLHLTYSLGIATFLLGLASLWSGCAAISQEAGDKTLHLLLVKPVPRLRIWLGKWLALLAMNAVLLSLTGLAAAAALAGQLRHGGFTDADLARVRQTTLSALETFRAPLPDIEPQVQTDYAALEARGVLPPGIAPSIVLDSIRRDQLARLYSMAPGEHREWIFALHDTPDPTPLLAQFRCDSSLPGATDVHLGVELAFEGETRTREHPALPGTVQTLVFEGLPSSGGIAAVTLHNRAERPATLFFDPTEGLVLRRSRGSFAANYLRALLQLFLRLALLSAIGVTLGTLFSMPVAAFLTFVLLLLLQLSGFVSAAAQTDRETFVAHVARFGSGGHSHGGNSAAPARPSRAARAAAAGLYAAYRATYFTLRPLLENRTLDRLAQGERIAPREVFRDLLQQGLALPLLLAGLSTAVLRRREWALPSST